MNEFLEWIKQFGLESPTLDGKILRFDREGKKNAWFWGVQLHSSRTGTPFILAIVGDWRTDEQFEFRSNFAFNRDEKRIIGAQITEAKEKADRQKEALQAEVANEAADILARGQLNGSNEYLKRKGIEALYGCRLGTDRMRECVLVPMRDINGKLWGIQKIFNDGSKYFLSGQRKSGCFHVIPEEAELKNNEEVVFVCEGFATAVSVHMATQCIVVVAFDAGNLFSVCEAIRKDCPDKPIVLCGDNDLWGHRADGSPYNAGKEKALATAEAILGKAVFPEFRDLTNNPTDFNDLHLREGLDAVKTQIQSVKPNRHYIRYLGHCDGDYYYSSSDNKEISIVSAQSHTQSGLLNLMPLAYWQTLYPNKKGVAWEIAADDLMRKSRERGVFDPEGVRGLGVWKDRGRTVVHLGDRLHVDNVDVGIHDLESRYHYQLASRCRSIHPEPLSLADCNVIHSLLNELHFERAEQKIFLGGWIMAARLSGFLDWRPHIWVTGEAGSGKSTIMKEFLHVMLGEQRFQFTGGTTEPGMRQTLRAHAVPVLYDEFESDGPDSAARVKSCLEYIRQSSTDAGYVVKGSASGSALQYKSRYCAAVSAIKTTLNNQADLSRFTLVELKKVIQDPAQWRRVQDALTPITPEFSDRYFARVLKMLPIFKKNLASLDISLAAKHSQRLAQQYAPLLAGWTILVRDTELEPHEVSELVESVDLVNEGGASKATDQDECLKHFLGSKTSVIMADGTRVDQSFSTLIQLAKAAPGLYAEQLETCGVALVSSVQNGDCLFIPGRHTQLSKIFYGSVWHSGWSSSLGRLPGAFKNCSGRVSRVVYKGTLVPLRLLES